MGRRRRALESHFALEAGKLPAPKKCPVCFGVLHQRDHKVSMLRRGRPDAWRYTGPDAPPPSSAPPPKTTTVRRTIYYCRLCSIRVVLHRDRRPPTPATGTP